MPSLTGAIASTLPRLGTGGAIDRPNEVVGASTLPRLATAIAARRPDQAATIATTLPKLRTSSGRLTRANKVVGRTTLPKLRAHGVLSNKVQIFVVTGTIRATGNGILGFIGPPHRAVEWSIVSGGGALIMLQDYTDQFGRASARYEFPGYATDVVVRVSYGT